MQQPMVAVQHAVMTSDSSQLATGTAMLTFMQFLGGAICVALAQTTFTNSLGLALKQYGAGVNASEVIGVGATTLEGSIPAEDLVGVLKAYNKSLDNVFVSQNVGTS